MTRFVSPRLLLILALFLAGSRPLLASSDIVENCRDANTGPASRFVLLGTVLLCSQALAEDGLSQYDQGEMLMSRGVAHRHLGNLENSLADLEAAVRIDPGTALNHRMLGWTYRLLGRLEQARIQYGKALAINREYQGLLSRCDISMSERKWVMAKNDCEESLTLDRNPDSLFMTADIHTRLGADALAVPLLEEAISRDDSEARAFALLWCIHKRNGRSQLAERARAGGQARFGGEYDEEERAVSCSPGEVS